jgi:release factor glutamine methyltransferase
MSFSRCGPLRIVAPPGVYSPRRDTALLATQLENVKGAAVLDLCTGSGVLALTAAHRGAATVVAVDCSRRAVLTARTNARINGLGVEVRYGDLWNALNPGERFDVILTNPPYLPVSKASRPDDRWDAGLDGRAILDRILEAATDYLRPSGRIVLVQSGLANLSETRSRMTAHGLGITGSVTHRGPFGPIGAARREELVKRGVIAEDEDEEALTVLIGAPRSAPSPDERHAP